NLFETTPHNKWELALAALSLLAKHDKPNILREVIEVRNAAVHGPPQVVNERWYELANELKNSQTTIIPLRIDEEPLTPQKLALVFTALTELTTKLWLIAQHRFADLIEYTQTHDVRFAN